MDFNNIENLNNINPMDMMNDSERNELNEIFSQSGMKDWTYDYSDNSLKLMVKMINTSSNPDPSYEKSGDSGFDLRAVTTSDGIVLEPLERVLVSTGLYFQIPVGFELQIRPRSGLALKNGITVLNSPGTVDAGYRGEIKVLLINLNNVKFLINNGDRIAQGVIAPVQTNQTTLFKKVNTLDTSDRNVGGFGSTGVK